MAKFKVGDKVRVVETKHDCKKHLVGKDFTIKKSFKGVGDNYVYDVGEEYLLNEPELELFTSKFKVGDKVRVIDTNFCFKKDYVGTCGAIVDIYPAYDDGRGLRYAIKGSSRLPYIFYGNELELIFREKPKFDINDYQRDYPHDYAMHCKTAEEANIFFRYLRWIGMSWWNSDLIKFKPINCCFNAKCYATVANDNPHYTILNFEDFDWSDFTMKKEFTKADLKEFDIVKLRNGDVLMVLRNNQSRDGLSIFNKKNWGCKEHLHSYTDDLFYSGSRCENDIVAVKKFDGVGMYGLLDRFFTEGRTLYMWDWERTEVEEMTLEEVCKALGKDIKIVKEK